ncbi:ATP-dependent RNA helicase p62 [Manduca sexta]|uniref:RNA helicase n=1 Tax=Manduca sexta TaxID=7130 RepID=A0A921YP33_MANSE|nr:ATP-dependent RNA helicase p62 [Manduca sexta]KAG6442202.1 hypothetical protein O3G_MSEX002199 [Manduca sexta]
MALNVITKFIRRKDVSILLSHHYKQLSTDVGLLKYLRTTALSHTNQYHHSQQSRLRQSYSHRFYSVKTAQQVDNYRTENKVTVIGEDIPSPYTDINQSDFPDYIKRFLNDQGFTTPTVIQSQSWPIALSGQNFVGIAQTGTGKTLAYLLPAVVHIKEKMAKKGRGPIALVLAPTRELARQIEAVAKDFESLLNIRCVCIYGGANRTRQANQLQDGVDIVIATPGRLNDFLVSKTTNLSRCTYVVLDEADRMLDMGFEPQIRQALEGVPLDRQILMFSATWPKEVRHLAKDYLGEFIQVNVGSTELSANHNIEQHVHICDQEGKLIKFKEIMHTISGDGFGKTLVFSNTKKSVDFLTQMLRRNAWPAMGIHGDKTQMQRDIIINKFKTGKTSILVATDVAARGLDVDGVTHVINYDYPNTSEDYIHRIGRTGRQQNKGVSHTILTEENARQAKGLIEVLKEANQEIPKELNHMAQTYNAERAEELEAKRTSKFKQHNFNPNRRWNKFRFNKIY